MTPNLPARRRPLRWPRDAGECKALSPISNPPRFRGKPTEQAALERLLTEYGYPMTTAIPQIFPMSVRVAAIDGAQRIERCTELVNQLMIEGVGTVFASFEANVRDSQALLRQIAVRRASEIEEEAMTDHQPEIESDDAELRGRFAGKGAPLSR